MKWVVSHGKDGCKARIVGREFKWSVERDDVFAVATTPLTGRLIDFLSLKDDDDPDDPLVTFVADCVSAYYRTPEDEEFYAIPPA
eukprot:4646537-Alexandrium_andersonii.AAC.1